MSKNSSSTTGRGAFVTKGNPRPVPKKGSSLGITSTSPERAKVQGLVKKANVENGC